MNIINYHHQHHQHHYTCYYHHRLNVCVPPKLHIKILIPSATIFPGGSDGKESTCNARDLGSSLRWEDPLEEGMATHSSNPSLRIPWTEKPSGLQSMGSQRVRHDWVAFTHSISSALVWLTQGFKFYEYSLLIALSMYNFKWKKQNMISSPLWWDPMIWTTLLYYYVKHYEIASKYPNSLQNVQPNTYYYSSGEKKSVYLGYTHIPKI